MEKPNEYKYGISSYIREMSKLKSSEEYPFLLTFILKPESKKEKIIDLLNREIVTFNRKPLRIKKHNEYMLSKIICLLECIEKSFEQSSSTQIIFIGPQLDGSKNGIYWMHAYCDLNKGAYVWAQEYQHIDLIISAIESIQTTQEVNLT